MNQDADGTSTRRTRRSATSDGGGAIEQVKRGLTVKRVIVIVIALVVIVFAFRFCSSAMGVQVMINGNQYTLRGEKTVATAASECGIPLNPGDLISIRGNVLTRHAGAPYSATVNGEEVTDYNQRLHDGDVVTLGDGKDLIEEYESYYRTIDYTAVTSGAGAIRTFTREGSYGSIEVRTGLISGEVVEKYKADPVDLVCTNYNPNVGSDKVIALTFDDGPSDEYTAAILDVLAANDAKATFFVIGTQVEREWGTELVQRAVKEGHLVCSHTYSHAKEKGSESNLANLNAEEQVEQVEMGIQAIDDALASMDEENSDQSGSVLSGLFASSNDSASGESTETPRIVRLPGGISNPDVMMNVYGLFDYEFGWTLDTGDWLIPGKDAIVEVLMSVDPGDIVRLHDGGGDRSQTIEALREALPKLKRQGYQFVTVDELLKYPAVVR